jgi:hypothetical protein
MHNDKRKSPVKKATIRRKSSEGVGAKVASPMMVEPEMDPEDTDTFNTDPQMLFQSQPTLFAGKRKTDDRRSTFHFSHTATG